MPTYAYRCRTCDTAFEVQRSLSASAPPTPCPSGHAETSRVFTPVVGAVPRELRGKLEAAEVFHEVLEHRWFLSEKAGEDVGLDEAVRSYVTDILPGKPDEQAVLGAPVKGAA